VSARGHNRFDVAAARRRCKAYRRRILDISQTVGALHIAPAFSCLEIVDVVYHGLMRKGDDGADVDRFLMSKGHGCMAQYAILEDLGVLDERELELYCKPGGRLGAHPDYGVPGIEASTGSLGHGLGMAAGMAYADKLQNIESVIYCLVGDGPPQLPTRLPAWSNSRTGGAGLQHSPTRGAPSLTTASSVRSRLPGSLPRWITHT